MKGNYIKYMIFSVLFFSVISIVFQIAVVENPGFNIFDLASNLLSELAGMIFTVLIFNEFINYRQQLSNAGKFRLLNNELEDLLKSIDFPFQASAQKCIADFDGSLWNKDTINIIRDKIILSQVDDCVYPAVPWYMIFSMQGEKIMRKCENIRIHYHDILDPKISDYLFYLLNTSEMLTDLSDIRKIYENDLFLEYNRSPNLGSYFACPTDRDLEVINNMNEWLADSKETSARQSNFKKYNKFTLIILSLIFTVSSVGFYTNGNYISGGIFSFITIMLLFILIKSYKK